MIKIVSDGKPGGTQVLLPDGRDIAPEASRIEIIIEPDKPAVAILTLGDIDLNVGIDVPDRDEAPPVELMDPVALHNARKLS